MTAGVFWQIGIPHFTADFAVSNFRVTCRGKRFEGLGAYVMAL
jgi:hypothetical protein